MSTPGESDAHVLLIHSWQLCVDRRLDMGQTQIGLLHVTHLPLRALFGLASFPVSWKMDHATALNVMAWQQIFHLECDVRPRERTVVVTVVGE